MLVAPSDPLVDLSGEDPGELLESLCEVDPEELPLVVLEESSEDEEESPCS